MSYLTEFITVAVVHLLAVAAPGPDFVLITRNSLAYSRKVGIYTSVGLGMGMIVHIAYCLVGIGLLISQSILAFNVIKYLGAAYLLWIGFQSIRAQKKEMDVNDVGIEKKEMSAVMAIRMGFLTNVLNPKATLFFLSLFTQVINPMTPSYIQALYGVEMVVAGITWFSVLSVFLSQKRVKDRFVAVGHYVERVTGATLIALGLKVALSCSE